MLQMQAGWSWERWRDAADTTPDVVVETDRDGLVVWLQPTVTALLGWDTQQLIGLRAADLVHPADLDRALAMRQLATTAPSRWTSSAASAPPTTAIASARSGPVRW